MCKNRSTNGLLLITRLLLFSRCNKQCERGCEFYMESYHWYDLKRTGCTELLTNLTGRFYLLYYPLLQIEKARAGHTQYPNDK